MIDYRILVPIVMSFLVTLFLIPFWERKGKQIGLVWTDMNKFRSEKVTGSGGIMVVCGFLIGILIYVAYKVFYLNLANAFLLEIFALLSVVLILAGVGFIDDLLGRMRGGLSRRSRTLLVLIASIPLAVINAGKSFMVFPFFGEVSLGWVYPFIFIPLGIIGATTTYNFLAGFNGLEAGLGILILSSLSFVAYLTGSHWLAVVGLCMVASLSAFLIFNFYPAKVFPGDALTYPVGGLIAIMAILGNFEKIAVFFFIPIILEFFLKARGRFVMQSFGKPEKDGSLSLKYNKIYSLNHLAIYVMKRLRVKPTEKKVVVCIWCLQTFVIVLGFLIFWSGLNAG